MLNKLARLDTCVTVVDSTSMFDQLDCIKVLAEHFGEEQADPEDARNVADLMVDQIEFADVILLNKMDVVSDKQAEAVLDMIKKLNPVAKVIKTSYSRVRCPPPTPRAALRRSPRPLRTAGGPEGGAGHRPV